MGLLCSSIVVYACATTRWRRRGRRFRSPVFVGVNEVGGTKEATAQGTWFQFFCAFADVGRRSNSGERARSLSRATQSAAQGGTTRAYARDGAGVWRCRECVMEETKRGRREGRQEDGARRCQSKVQDEGGGRDVVKMGGKARRNGRRIGKVRMATARDFRARTAKQAGWGRAGYL